MVKKSLDVDDFVLVDGIKCTTAAPLVDIDTIIPYEKNARLHGTELEFLKNAIKDPRIGFRDPIEVDGDMIIVAGHGRRQAALELGMTKVPCLIHKDMHGDASDAYRLISNRTSDLSGWSYDILSEELSALKDIGWEMEQFSFEDMASFDEPESPFEPEETDYVEETAPGAPSGGSCNLMVYCDDSDVQRALFERLREEGYRCQML